MGFQFRNRQIHEEKFFIEQGRCRPSKEPFDEINSLNRGELGLLLFTEEPIGITPRRSPY